MSAVLLALCAVGAWATDSVLWQGPQTADGEQKAWVEKTTFDALSPKVGDIITAYYEAADLSQGASLKICGHGESGDVWAGGTLNAESGTIQVTLNADMVQKLQANDTQVMVAIFQKCTLKKVVFTPAGSTPDPDSGSTGTGSGDDSGSTGGSTGGSTVTVPTGATSVFNGSVDLGNWTNEVRIEADKWQTLKEGDEITVAYTLSTISGEDWHQLQFNDGEYNRLAYTQENGGQYGSHDVDASATTYTFTVGAADVATLKAKGMIIKGHALVIGNVWFTTTSSGSTGDGTGTGDDGSGTGSGSDGGDTGGTTPPLDGSPVVWEGTQKIEWSEPNVLYITPQMLTRLTTESTLTLKFKQDKTQTWWTITVANQSPYEKIVADKALSSGTSSLEITNMTAAQVANAKANGMMVQGQNFTMTKVILTNPDDPKWESPATDPVSATEPYNPNDLGELWGGSANFEDWDEEVYVEIPGERLKALNVDENTQFTLTYVTDPSYEWWQVQFGDKEWTNLQYDIDYGNKWGSIELGKGTTSYKFRLTQADIDLVEASALRIKGHAITLTGVRIDQKQASQPIPNGGFYVDKDNHAILDANGNQFVMRGVNYSYAWQSGGMQGVIEGAGRQGFNCIRLNLSDGSRGDGTRNQQDWKVLTATQLEAMIQLCEENHLVAVLNTQNQTGVDTYADLQAAVDYWISMKDVLNRHKSTVIVNIANEWYGSWSSTGWRDGYLQAIPLLRQAGIKNLLMVDCAGYGQYPQSLYDFGNDVFNADVDQNTMFSIHMYEDAAPTAEKVASIFNETLRSLDAPFCIGEFGSQRQGKAIAYQEIMNQCQTNHIGWIAWSWTGNGGSESDLDMFSDYTDNTMLTNGERIINGTNGVKETSTPCTVFTASSTAIDRVTVGGGLTSGSATVEYFDLQGRQIQKPQSGICLRRENGKVRKVLVK